MMVPEKARVMVVDDEPIVLESWQELLGERYQVTTFLDPLAAAHHVGKSDVEIDVALLDVRMPGLDGLGLLKIVKEKQPGAEVIMVTAHGSIPMAVDALQAGAYDFLQKPVEDLGEALGRIERAVERRRLRALNQVLARKVEAWSPGTQIVGETRAIVELRQQIERIADSPGPVVVQGEPGTGKALVVRALHGRGQRAQRPLVIFEAAARRSTEVITRELFGSDRTPQTGLWAKAQGGVLYLREIGELPVPVQTRLLRALEEPGGGDVRVVAGTSHNLKSMVTKGRFRAELYARLSTFTLALPPLRERPADVPLIAHHLLRRHVERMGVAWRGFSDEALDALCEYSWPGNVRELDGAIEHALTLADGALIEIGHLPPAVTASGGSRPRRGVLEGLAPGTLASSPYAEARRRLLRDFDTRYWEDLLEMTEGNLSEAARRSGLDRSNLRRRLRRAGVPYDTFRPSTAGGERAPARRRRLRPSSAGVTPMPNPGGTPRS
jgi:DNA-binding NtrC family response regulator